MDQDNSRHKSLRLGVNIDHVATLRQARGEDYPSLEEAGRISLEAGADQITIHLREDRRHIQDQDVYTIRALTEKYQRPLNLEMGHDLSVMKVAVETKPNWICLVPEKREEKTTEGGLNLHDQSQTEKINKLCHELKNKIPQVKISLFLEADDKILHKAVKMPIDAVEIHTGEWAKAFLENKQTELKNIDQLFFQAAQFLESQQVACHAGHGLTRESVLPLLKSGYFEEYNIGHWIISQAVFQGLHQVIHDLKGLFHAYRKH